MPAASADAAVARTDDASPPATRAEVRSWYTVDVSNSVAMQVSIAGFLPLLIQSAGLAQAGFPAACANVVTNAAAIAAVFGNDTGAVAMRFLGPAFPGLACDDDPLRPTCAGGWCRGWPASVDECRATNGLTPFPLRIAGTNVDPTTFATTSISVSVGAQALLFVLVAALADHGGLRKRLLLLAALVGGTANALCAAITPSSWWLGLPLLVVVNGCFGLSSIMYNAYLPLLVKALPEVRLARAREAAATASTATAVAAGGGGRQHQRDGAYGALGHSPRLAATASRVPGDDEEGEGRGLVAAGATTPVTAAAVAAEGVLVSTAPLDWPAEAAGVGASSGGAAAQPVLSFDELGKRKADELSSVGFAWGYAASTVGILLCVPLAFALPELPAYQASMVVSGAWWIIFSFAPWRYLHPRPGPPLPPGRSFVAQSAASLGGTFRALWQLRVTLAFIVLWSIFSDAAFLIGTVGGLFANSQVSWSCKGLPKPIGIVLVFFLSPLFGIAGNLGFWRLAERYRWSSRTMLVASLVACSAIPAYGLIGFASQTIGLRQGWEVVMVAAVYGSVIGPIQAFSRSIFASLIPRGNEAAFYALYELTNRGSSAIGPLVLTAIQQSTGELRWAFIFIISNLIIPAAALLMLDLERGKREAEAFGAAAAKRAATEGTDAVAVAGGAGGDADAAWSAVGSAHERDAAEAARMPPLRAPE